TARARALLEAQQDRLGRAADHAAAVGWPREPAACRAEGTGLRAGGPALRGARHAAAQGAAAKNAAAAAGARLAGGRVRAGALAHITERRNIRVGRTISFNGLSRCYSW